MSHEVKKFKGILVDKEGKIIGFTLSGETFDGDGNIQWEEGTDMEIVFKNTKQARDILTDMLKQIKEADKEKGQ